VYDFFTFDEWSKLALFFGTMREMCIRFRFFAPILGGLLLAFATPTLADRPACALLDTAEVAAALGVPVVNVREQNRATFSSCSFETDNWQLTAGLIYHPNLPSTTAEALAVEFRADLERDAVPYADFAIEESLGVPAVYYRAPEDDFHSLVAQSGGDRLIFTGPSRDAVLALSAAALAHLAQAVTPR